MGRRAILRDLPVRKRKTRRPDPKYCMAGLHRWVPENLLVRGTHATCRPCMTANSRKPGIGRHLAKTYGLTVEQYDALLASQGGVCAICQRPPDDFKHRLAVDHQHSSGIVRGILCTHCNQAIGSLMDRPDLCIAAAEYLRARAHCAAPASAKRRPSPPKKTRAVAGELPFDTSDKTYSPLCYRRQPL